MNFSTTNSATKKETTNPIAISRNCVPVIDDIFVINSYPVAINMVGIARKNENSAAAKVESPTIHPPIIVEADLENPGHTTERH